MNEDQIFRALDAIYDAIMALSAVAHETIDHQDGRLEELREATKSLHDTLYVENHEHPSR